MDTVIEHQSFFRKWSSLIVMSLALAIIIIDTTLLNVSLGNIIRDLNTDIKSLQWVITAYSLTMAALTVTGGRIGDIFGKKRMFMLGAIIFATGSFIASISNSVGVLLIGESIIEGIGAALMMPATTSLLVANFHGRDRAIAFGIWGGIAAASSAIGPILGGFLATNYSWRWGFRINVFVTILLLLGSILIKENDEKRGPISLDWGGVFLSSTGLLSVVFGLIESSTYGWWSAKETFVIFNQVINLGGYSIVPFALLIGLILIVLFVLWELRQERQGISPLVSMKLFHNKQFTSGVITMGVMSLGQAGIIFTIPVFFQSVKSLDAFHTGLALLPMSLTLLFFAPFSAFLSKTIPPKRLIQFGLFLNVVAIFVLRQSFTVGAEVSDFTPGLLLYGMGMGLIMAQINNIALSAVSISQAGQASGINNTLRQVGTSLGSAIIGAVLLSTLSVNLVNGIRYDAFLPMNVRPYLEKTISQQLSNVEFAGGAKIDAKLSPELMNHIQYISHQAIADANQTAMLYAAFFGILGFFAASRLPNTKKLEKADKGEGG